MDSDRKDSQDKPPEEDPVAELALLLQDYPLTKRERLRCGISDRRFRQMLALVRELIVAEGFVLED